MTTRRIVATEKTFLDKDDPIDEHTSTAPAVPAQVIYKLLAFTFAMIVVPIGSYFVTVNTIFSNSSLAGGLAAVMANVVLVGYIIVAMKEDQSDTLNPESKKDK
ncbi:probable Vacuolar ATPase assembly integral membrane protein VMA21 [Fusarium torulosum]|uniref:Probable Vacuolar ATPase assembly integral membrane protein VMA21 n=1 Tax=Fusarium torulosum TaxID=33205 RepID=A0AAE8ML91_9HYPO|nr:probable Vacuolar ATPase assembly integral membrane protein VMA21 [Fusarium torulosum]